MKAKQLPALVQEMLLNEELAQSMEDTLGRLSQAELDGRRMRRYDKAGTYTLAEKYKAEIERLKQR